MKRDAALASATPVSNIFIMEYMPQAPDGYVKVYLYGLMCTSSPVLSGDAAGALGMEETEVLDALAYWRSRGLIEILDTDPVTVRYAPLSMGAPAPTRENAAFIGMVQGALNGRFLSSAELQKIYDWMDVFGMEEACALMLVTYCAEQKGSRVSISYMDAVARSWANEGVLTAAAAEKHISDRRELAGGAQALLRRWRMTRRPTQDELELYGSWREQGFDDAAIAAACAEMTGAEHPSFKYLNSVLMTFKLKGASDSAAIAELAKSRDAAVELLRLCFERAGIKRAPSARDIEQMQIWREDRHMDSELILLAADASRDSSQPAVKLRHLIDDWYASGIKTVAEGKKALEASKAAGSGRSTGKKSTGYIQRTYSAEDFKNIGIKLLDDED